MNVGKVILGWDLNFSLNSWDVWGAFARVDRIDDFFNYHIEFVSLINIEPISMGPTLRNNRVGDEGVSKSIDRFLVLDALLQRVGKYRS